MQTLTQYNASAYVRLSKEDFVAAQSKYAESNSITNQKQLILDFVESKPEINIVSIRVDDGYTGTDFDRPAFQLMMDDIRAGKVNCVVVKDLSRFGREYINAGKYIDRLFPFYGVRLIAINDGIDTITRSSSDDFNITLKNLMNDNYCRDISVKIRSQLQVKRKRGEFLGAFAPYGYMKAEDDHNRLEIDPYAAGVVQDIFRWKLDGYSQDGISKKLTAMGILSPLEYKRSLGYPYKSGFKAQKSAAWTPVAVRRILTNPVYLGILTQGIRTCPNYKIKKRIVNDEASWVRYENAHEAIISERAFSLVSRLLKLDTRTSPDAETVSPLAGLLECGDCGAPMVRKTTTSNGRKYDYSICSTYKNEKACSAHRISEEIIENVVLRLLQEHIRILIELDRCLQIIKDTPLSRANIIKAQDRYAKTEIESERYHRLKASLYEDWKEGILSKEDYMEIRDQYDEKLADLVTAQNQIQREIDANINTTTSAHVWIQEFVEYQNIKSLSRKVAVECIEKIRVFEGKKIEVVFTHAQDYIVVSEKVRELIDHTMEIEKKEAI